jgi:hypothetical protein
MMQRILRRVRSSPTRKPRGQLIPDLVRRTSEARQHHKRAADASWFAEKNVIERHTDFLPTEVQESE